MIFYRQKLKQKLINHYLKNGSKKTCENILLKTLKSIQKSNIQAHTQIVRMAILNVTPTFRVIKLRDKRKKRKSKQDKKIPAFLSSYKFRSSWALKHIISTSRKIQLVNSEMFFNQLKREILRDAMFLGDSIEFKSELQKQALNKKKFLRHYRW